MKKILMLLVAFITMTWFANAQTVLFESFEGETCPPAGWTTIDNDGDGFNWHYAQVPKNKVHDGTQCIVSNSYDNDSYTALTPDNWLISPAVTLSSNASAINLTFWIAGQNPNYCAENFSVMVSTTGTAIADFTSAYTGTATGEYVQHTVPLNTYAGQTIYIAFRHHNSTDQFQLNLDEVTVKEIPNTPYIDVTPSVTFNETIVDEFATATVPVVAYNLTSTISVTTAAPFSVSSNGTTFGTTATLPTAGGDLYIKYSPTTDGDHTGTVTLSSTGAPDVTISVSGSAVDCSGYITIPYTEGFENGLHMCYGLTDADGDGVNWLINELPQFAHSGNKLLVSLSSADMYGVTSLDNWFILPEFTVGTNYTELTFWAGGLQSNEKYDVLVSTTGTDTADFTSVLSVLTPITDAPETDLEKKTINLSSYAGQTIHIAFRHYDIQATANGLRLDDIAIKEWNGSTIEIMDSTLTFSETASGTSKTLTTSVFGHLLTSGITATATAPFSVSTDGITFSNTVNLTADGGNIYVKYSPTAGGTHESTIELTSGTTTASINLVGNAIDCDVITEYPFVQGFDDGMPACWLSFNPDDSSLPGWEYNTIAEGVLEGAGAMLSANINDWLVTPELAINNSALMTFNIKGSLFDMYEVLVSTTGADTADFNVVYSAEAPYEGFAEVKINLTEYMGDTIRVAFRHASGFLFVGAFLDELRIDEITEPTVYLSTEDLDFGTIPAGSEMVKTFNVEAYALEAPLTATTTAPFSVSADGTTYGLTANMPIGAGGAFYVKYAPTVAGDNTALVELTSTNFTPDTVHLTGSAIVCETITEFPYEENFDEGEPVCWLNIDADGDGNKWELSEGGAEGTNGCMSSASYNFTALTPDNWLITQDMVISGPSVLTFYVQSSANYPDPYSVFISTNGTDLANFTEVHQGTAPAEYTLVTVSLDEYIGQTINIAFRHYNCTDNLRLFLDQVKVNSFSEPTIETVPTSVDFGSVIAGYESAPQEVTVNAYALQEGANVTATTAAPFSISIDGNTYGTTATITTSGDPLYIKYAPATAGTDNGTVTLTSAGAADATISLTGSAYTCDPVTEFPFEEGFETGELPNCWSVIDADGDGNNWDPAFLFGEEDVAHSGVGLIASASFINYVGPAFPDNWLISPALQTGDKDLELSYWVSAQDPDFGNEVYDVYVSTTGITPADFTSVYSGVSPTDWEERTVTLGSEYHNKTIHIAFRHHDVTDQYWIKLDDVTVSETEGGTGVADFENHVNVYPNPVNNIINVNANSNIENIAIYDLAGAQVGFYNGNGYDTQISVSNLANGMYFLKIKTDNGMITKKVNVVK